MKKSRLLGYGFVLLGLVIIFGGMAYRLSIAPLGAAPPRGAADEERFALAGYVILGGGVVAVLGALIAFMMSRKGKGSQ